MKNHTTESAKLHSLREEFRKARLPKRAITINAEDAIFNRLVEAAELLTVATGLFCELRKDQDNWLHNHQGDIASASAKLNDVVGKGVGHGLLL